MATLTLKNVPDPLYARLKAQAADNRRSLNGEAIRCLEEATVGGVPAESGGGLEALRRRRAMLAKVTLTDKAVRASREGGRS